MKLMYEASQPCSVARETIICKFCNDDDPYKLWCTHPDRYKMNFNGDICEGYIRQPRPARKSWDT